LFCHIVLSLSIPILCGGISFFVNTKIINSIVGAVFGIFGAVFGIFGAVFGIFQLANWLPSRVCGRGK